MHVGHPQLPDESGPRLWLGRAIILAVVLAFGLFVAALDNTLWAGHPPEPAASLIEPQSR